MILLEQLYSYGQGRPGEMTQDLCSLSAVEDANEVADMLGIPFTYLISGMF